MEPALTPAQIDAFNQKRSRANTTPMWLKPLAPPPLKAKPRRGPLRVMVCNMPFIVGNFITVMQYTDFAVRDLPFVPWCKINKNLSISKTLIFNYFVLYLPP